MLPLLRFAQDGQEHQLRDAIPVLADEFSLTADEKNEFLPSGQQPVCTSILLPDTSMDKSLGPLVAAICFP
ncbi:MAG: winged helix-turn-helix domain-containing protein [bacterium]|nr:winged helix-turn-helix domain-containing protein [bacterium]